MKSRSVQPGKTAPQFADPEWYNMRAAMWSYSIDIRRRSEGFRPRGALGRQGKEADGHA